jgi:hypothetical protein
MSGEEPADAAAYLGRAQAWLSKGDVDSAIADFTAAIGFNPKSPEVYHGVVWRG